MSSSSSKPSYNTLFEKLVLETEENSADRLIGMLAYAKYKLEKNEFYRNHYDEYGCNPDEETVKKFILSYSQRRISDLRNDAENGLYAFGQQYLDNYFDDAKATIIEDSVVTLLDHKTTGWQSTLEEMKRKILSEVKVPIVKNIGLSFLGALLFSVFIGAVVIAISISFPDSNAMKIIRSLTNDNIRLELKD